MAYVASRPSSTSAWPLAVVGVALLAIGVVFADTLKAMAAVWSSSNSFAHGPLIPLASLWLVSRQRERLSEIHAVPWWPALAILAIGGFGWLLGRLAGVNTVEQLAVVGMIPATVALVLGWRIAWAIAFPLAFLLFAVPFGTFMLPTLIDWTGDFTVAAVRATGIPVFREGPSFALPSGRWSVVESCSGIRYLLAALPLGCLYAYLSYRTQRARVIFIALTVAVALVANWIRAFIIVMLGHLSGMKIAVGADHLVYGWVFFGIVMGTTFWLGGFVRDPIGPGAPTGEGDGTNRAGDASLSAVRPNRHDPFEPGNSGSALTRSTVAGLIAIALSATWPATATNLRASSDSTIDLSRLGAIFEPILEPEDPTRIYRPTYQGDAARFVGMSKDDPQVRIAVFQYVRQGEGSEMIHEMNRPMPGVPDDVLWQIRSRASVLPASLGSTYPAGQVAEYLIAGPDGLHLVWEWFQVGERTHASPARTKLQTAISMLAGHGDESLAWYLWTPLPEGHASAEVARTRLAQQAWRAGNVPLGHSR